MKVRRWTLSMTAIIALLGAVLSPGVLAEDCSAVPVPEGAKEISCLRHEGLLVRLTTERHPDRNQVLTVRFFGGIGETFSVGHSRLLYEEVVGAAPGEFLRFSEKHTMLIKDVNADGFQELLIGALVPVSGAERKLKIYSLNPDPREFTGVVFFRHAPGWKETSYVAAPLSSEITIGRTLRVNDRSGSYREYKFFAPNIYQLIYDTREGREYDWKDERD